MRRTSIAGSGILDQAIPLALDQPFLIGYGFSLFQGILKAGRAESRKGGTVFGETHRRGCWSKMNVDNRDTHEHGLHADRRILAENDPCLPEEVPAGSVLDNANPVMRGCLPDIIAVEANIVIGMGLDDQLPSRCFLQGLFD